jgi:hypothetical protein
MTDAYLIDVILSEETWNAIHNNKAKHISMGVTPNWLFFSTKFVSDYPELKHVKMLSGMSVHICELPEGYDMMMVRLDDSSKQSITEEEK